MSKSAQRSFSRSKFLSGHWKTKTISGGFLRYLAMLVSFKRQGVDYLARKCLPHFKVIDFGSGRSAYSRWFFDRCPCTIVAVDWSPEALKGAKLITNKGKILPVCADLHMLPFKHNSADMLFSIDTLGHLQNQEKALDEILRVTCPGALLFLHSECGDYRKRWPDDYLIKKIGYDFLAQHDGHYSIRPSIDLYNFYFRRFKILKFFSPAGLLGWLLGYPDKYVLAFKKARMPMFVWLTSVLSFIKNFPILGAALRFLNALTNKSELMFGIEGGGSCFALLSRPLSEINHVTPVNNAIDIVIPTYKRADSVYMLLGSLLKQCRPDDAFYVIWQGEEKPAVPESNQIHCLFCPTPNLPAARNLGIKAGHNPIILFLDDDVIPEEELLKEHRKCYGDTSIGGVAGYIDDPLFNKDLSSPSRFNPRTGELLQNFSFPESRFTISMMGANMSFRKDALVKIGGFDPNFLHNAHWEDVDCAFRLLKAGFAIWYCEEAKLQHIRNKDGGCRSVGGYQFIFHSFANTSYFACKFISWSAVLPWIRFWKYRLEFQCRKNQPQKFGKIGHDPIAIFSGVAGAISGIFRFFISGKRTCFPQEINKLQELKNESRMDLSAS